VDENMKKIETPIEEKPLKYNLACGEHKIQDFVGVDAVKTEAADVVYDLEKYPWKFAKDNSADEIWCSHYVEHTSDLMKFMDECYRILKPGGRITVVAPYYSSMRAMQDPTHKRFISEMTWYYFNKDWRVANKLEHYGIKSDFDFSWGYSWSPLWVSKSDEARNYALIHYNNVVSDIQVILIKK
jgi:SAM-dependent methyltransferase